MTKPAAIPYFGDAYLADTRHLTLEEHGAYHLLILIAWRTENCALPNDDQRLAQMLGITPKKWAKLKPTVMAFWTLTENGFEQKRLTKEFRFVINSREQKSNAANAMWEAKRLKNNEVQDASAVSPHKQNGCGIDAPPPPPPQESKNTANAVVISSEMPPLPELEDFSVKPEHVIEAWNMTAKTLGLQQVKKFTPERRRKLNTFIRRHTIDEITEGFAAIPRSPFLRGENPRGWRADFDWVLEPRNFTKLTEGTYG